jgi:hypothetical protein
MLTARVGSSAVCIGSLSACLRRISPAKRAALCARPGAPWAGGHSPLHAFDRRRRAGARTDDRTRAGAHDVRQEALRAWSVAEWIAKSRVEIEHTRLFVLNSAWMVDNAGAKEARNEIAIIKALVPTVHTAVRGRAIQTFGAVGLNRDTPLADSWTWGRLEVRRRPARGAGRHTISFTLTRPNVYFASRGKVWPLGMPRSAKRLYTEFVRSP